MQAFNFFVVATAFLIAAYASILEKHPAAAAVLALVGAWLTFWFNRLDARSRQLVEAGEDALRVSQARLASVADNQSLMILDAVDEPVLGASSYRRVITVTNGRSSLCFLSAPSMQFGSASGDILKRISASRPSGEWNDVLADGVVVGRITRFGEGPVPSRLGRNPPRPPSVVRLGGADGRKLRRALV